MRTINLYWVFAGRRLMDAQSAQGMSITPDDAAFLAALYNDVEVARMENAVIQVTPDDWRRVLSMIPEAKPLQPPRIKDQPTPLEINKPWSPRGGTLTEVPQTAPVSAISGEPDGNVVEMHPPQKPETLQ
jgi:hypothetical protein